MFIPVKAWDEEHHISTVFSLSNLKQVEWQWVAEVTNVLVYANPENTAARLLCADALEQLGYQAESETWRNAYLSAALELRNGNAAKKGANAKSDGSILKNMTAEMVFDYIGILLDKHSMSKEDFTINVNLTDTNGKNAPFQQRCTTSV